jgi:hypothetical protein
MGLDWIAFTYDEDLKKWTHCDMFRGKGVAYDKNIENLGNDLDNMCYGHQEHNHKDINELPYIPRNEKWKIITAIRQLCEKEESEIIVQWDDETYEDWLDFMQRAEQFLVDNEFVFCWY